RAAAQENGGPGPDLKRPRPIQVSARALPHFQPSRSGVRRFGDLEYRGGMVLTSPSEHFGGWSGLVMDTDGKRLLSVSDVGSWMTAEVQHDDAGAPTGLARARIGPLLALRGRPLRNKREQDAEAVALLDGSLERGTLLVGFERLHRIGRFPVRGGEVLAPSDYIDRPSEARRMPTNQGFEAVAVLQAGPLRGSIVAFAERFTRGSGYHTGWIWTRGRAQRFQLQDIDGFNITDAAGLPDGGLLVLERYFRWLSGVHMRIRRLGPSEIRPGARLTGHTVVQVDSGHAIDNMEGLAVHRGARGETVVSLISDNNFRTVLQRTVLLQFTLVE
ncbi:MAG: esterase-like activity of phytase family protein, partial [Hyphomicrobiaceae bacterium]